MIASIAASPAHAQIAAAPWASDHVLVKLRPGALLDPAALAAVGAASIQPAGQGARANAIVASQIGLDRWHLVGLAPGVDPERAVATLRGLASVERASLDGIGGLADVIPDDPSFSMQWALKNTGQVAGGVAGSSGADVKATEAWSLVTGGRSIVVAVLDAGVSNHPDLAGRILPGWNVPQGNDDTSDICASHGSHVSGILGAAGDNGTAIAGLCWDVRIMPVVIVNPCTGLESWVADGITWAVDHGAEIINMSLQYNVGSDYLHDAVLYAAAAGVPMIAAAGNSNATPPAFPARWPETIAVAATNNQDMRWSSSNFGNEIDVAAPGVSVLSLSATGGTTLKNGTSMAAPHVTGIVALMRSVNAALTREQILEVLVTTADDVNAEGFDVFTGWGRVNALGAVEAAIDLVEIPGDVNGDRVVDGADVTVVLGNWGACEACAGCAGDANHDCVVDGADVTVILGNWSAP